MAKRAKLIWYIIEIEGNRPSLAEARNPESAAAKTWGKLYGSISTFPGGKAWRALCPNTGALIASGRIG